MFIIFRKKYRRWHFFKPDAMMLQGELATAAHHPYGDYLF